MIFVSGFIVFFAGFLGLVLIPDRWVYSLERGICGLAVGIGLGGMVVSLLTLASRHLP